MLIYFADKLKLKISRSGAGSKQLRSNVVNKRIVLFNLLLFQRLDQSDLASGDSREVWRMIREQKEKTSKIIEGEEHINTNIMCHLFEIFL